MPDDPYANVRLLSISVIAEKWYRERTLGLDRATIERELRYALINMSPERDWRVDGLIPEEDLPEPDDLPCPEKVVSRSWVREFAEKQKNWPLPRFWFPDEAPPARRKGRPSEKDAILQELERRANNGEVAETVTAEARYLCEWLVSQGKIPLKVASVRKMISAFYHSSS